jgi:hypothetical protein
MYAGGKIRDMDKGYTEYQGSLTVTLLYHVISPLHSSLIVIDMFRDIQ